MLEFLGFAPDPRIPEGAYSWQHLTFVTTLNLLMIAAAVWLGLKNKQRSEQDKNRVLIGTAILVDTLEILRVVVLCLQSEDPHHWLYELPLFLCGLTLVAIPLAAFSRGKVREAALDFTAIFGIIGALLGTYGAAQNYNAYPVFSFLNVVSGLTHTISGFASLYILISGMAAMNKKNIGITVGILLAFCGIAYGVNVGIDYNYMFLMSHDGTPYSLLWDLVGGNQIGYSVGVVVLFLLYIALFYAGAATVKTLRRKHK